MEMRGDANVKMQNQGERPMNKERMASTTQFARGLKSLALMHGVVDGFCFFFAQRYRLTQGLQHPQGGDVPGLGQAIEEEHSVEDGEGHAQG